MTPAAADDLDAAVAEFLQAEERGAAPDPAEWIARHPAHAAGLAAFFADLGRFAPLLGLSRRPALDETADYRGSADPAADGPPGERFGDYELLDELGRGGMGVVYKARLVGTNLVVALKLVRPGGLGGTDAVARFREEVTAATGLRHPHVVPVYHVGESAGRPFYTMALIEGGGLDRHLPRFRADPAAAAALVAKVARAVHHAHQRRVLHRDLKPSNILLDEAGEPHVADFGLAARLDAGGAAAGEVAGSLPWMAPEAVRGDPVLTTAVDVWALGVILYELLAGGRPFRGDDREAVRRAILEAEPTPPRVLNPKVDRDLDAIVRRCLAKDPDRRYESATAVALDLDRWRTGEPVRARQAGRLERVARWVRRSPAAAGGAAVLAAALVAGAWVALSVAREQEARLRREVCMANEHAAGLAADVVLWQLQNVGDAVLDAAADPALHEAARAGDFRVGVTRVLEDRVRKRAAGPPPAFASMYLMDPNGVIRAEWPEERPVVGKDYSGRDYFRGAVRHAGRAGRDRIHVSRVFESENDGLHKLAVSAPVGLPGRPGETWVLAATVTTDPSLGLIGLHDDRRQAVAALIAPRDTNPPRGAVLPAAAPTEYLILLHRGYDRGQRPVPFPAGKLPPGRVAGTEPELQLPREAAPIPADDDYADPVGAVDPRYAGRWLAGFAPVGNTELVVLIQQPYEEAVGPHRTFLRRFLAAVGGAAGLTAVVLLLTRLRRPRAAG